MYPALICASWWAGVVAAGIRGTQDGAGRGELVLTSQGGWLRERPARGKMEHGGESFTSAWGVTGWKKKG